jgi:hypothetical protein
VYRSAGRFTIDAPSPRLDGGKATATVAGAGCARASGGSFASCRRPPPRIEYHLVATDAWMRLPGRTEPHFTFGLATMDPRGPHGVASRWRGRALTPGPILTVEEGQWMDVSIHDIGLYSRPDFDANHVLRLRDIEGSSVVEGIAARPTRVAGERVLSRSLRFDRPGTHVYGVEFEDPHGAHLIAHGLVIVRPRASGDGAGPSGEREFTLVLGQLRAGAYDPRLSRQDIDLFGARPDYFTINGRSYPDTVRSPNDPSLASQPATSLIRLSDGETARLVTANTCDEVREIAVSGLELQVVGDPSPWSTSAVYTSQTIGVRPGAVKTALISAPPFDTSEGVSWDRIGPFNRYLYAGTDPRVLTNGNWAPTRGPGGMTTEVRVYPADSLAFLDTPHPRRRRGLASPRMAPPRCDHTPALDRGVRGA